MDAARLVPGWRGLSVEVSERLGRRVGAGQVRWRVDCSGRRIGRRLGNTLVFDEADVRTVVELFRQAGGLGGDPSAEGDRHEDVPDPAA